MMWRQRRVQKTRMFTNVQRTNVRRVLQLSKAWMFTILKELETRYGLTTSPEYRLRKKTFTDPTTGKFNFTVSGFLKNEDQKPVFVIIHHFELPAPAKQQVTYIRIVKNGTPQKELLLIWTTAEKKPILMEAKELPTT